MPPKKLAGEPSDSMGWDASVSGASTGSRKMTTRAMGAIISGLPAANKSGRARRAPHFQKHSEDSRTMTNAQLQVQGMTCGHCVTAVEKALRSKDGVRSASVDLQAGVAKVEFDESAVDADQLIAVVEEEGYTATLGNS